MKRNFSITLPTAGKVEEIKTLVLSIHMEMWHKSAKWESRGNIWEDVGSGCSFCFLVQQVRTYFKGCFLSC